MLLHLKRAAFVAAAFACAIAASAADLRVSVIAGSSGDCLQKGVLRAVSDDGKKSDTPLVPGKTSYVLTLPAAGLWTVQAATETCWSESRAVLDGAETDITLKVYRKATVEGDFTAKQAVTSLRGTVFVHPAAGENREDGADVDCRLSKLHWQCGVPAGVFFDLRLTLPGFAAAHYWDLMTQAGRVTKLAAPELHTGASIAGWVRDQKDRPLKNALVTCFHAEASTPRPQHVAAHLHTARTTSRGFFQCTGLLDGTYRVLAESPGFSPTLLRNIGVAAGDNITLPRPIRPTPLAEVGISFDPRADRFGKPWQVELAESTPIDSSRPLRTITRIASATGWVKAQGLRADVYEVTVRDSKGAFVEHTVLDMADGGPHTLALSIHPVALRGVIRSGKRPLKADLVLSDQQGKFVKASADDDGRFEATLPAAGQWAVTVLYPPGSSPARISTRSLQIREEQSDEVVIEIPGGRLHGKVTGKNGEVGRAAVHARWSNGTAAQQMTDESGAFDLIGLGPGTYLLDAQNQQGTTPQPVPVTLEKDESRDVTLVTEQALHFSGIVLTPSGHAASGAIVRLFGGDGHGWTTLVTDVRGQFDYEAGNAARAIQIVVLTYEFPIAFVSAVPQDLDGNRQLIQLRPDGGTVRVSEPRTALVSANGVAAPYGMLRLPERYGQPDSGVVLESGAYVVCQQHESRQQCRNLSVASGSSQFVDAAEETRP